MAFPSIFRTPPFRVLVVGDVMVDRYIRGIVNRISPEAPVPIVRLRETDDRLGGAANVALNLRNLRAEVTLCAVVGEDRDGSDFRDAAEREGVNTASVVLDPSRRTTVKTRVIAGNQHLLRIDEEDLHRRVRAGHAEVVDLHPLADGIRDRLLSNIESLLRNSPPDVVLLQDYDKGVLDERTIPAIIGSCRSMGIPVAVDPKFEHFMAYRGVSLFKPNLKELGEGLGRMISPTEADLEQACMELHHRLDHAISLITLSEKGVFWFDHSEGTHGLVPPVPRDIVDVCGAGDTVIAAAALALAAGWPTDALSILSNLAGGQVCERVGVVPVSLDLLLEEFSPPS